MVAAHLFGGDAELLGDRYRLVGVKHPRRPHGAWPA